LKRNINQVIGVFAHINIKVAALAVQFFASVAFSLMGSFLPLFISSEIIPSHSLIEATYWTGIVSLVGSSLYAISAPFWGYICERVGTKKIMIIVLAGNAVVYAGMAFSTSVLQVVLFRGLQGTFGGLSTVMFVLIATLASAAELKKALSYQIAAMTAGSLIGPGLGGLLAYLIGYRLTFVASSLIFLCLAPIAFGLKVPKPKDSEIDAPKFKASDLKALMSDAIALVLIYACISFIIPTIPWFLESMGIPAEQLLTFTTLVTVLNGLAFTIATPLLTRVVTDRTLPIFSVAASGAILTTAFVTNPYHFLAIRVAIGSIQAGLPPSLLGGKSGRRGTAMGILNSARFLGQAIGPFIATSILGNGEPPKAMYMFTTMTIMSLIASLFIYLTHTKKGSTHKTTSQA
jgi:DHA1 family multidrug resistance protein-like MFS transporter